MNEQEQEQRRQIELTVNINEQAHTYRHTTIDPSELPGYVDQAKQRAQALEARRRQIWGEQVQAQAQAQVNDAAPQQEQPVAAPPQETYKQRRERERNERQAVRAGRRYAPHANIHTDSLMRIKAQNDPLTTGPEGIPSDAQAQVLDAAVKRMTETRISADMFSERNFPEKSVILRRCLYEYKSIGGLMQANPAYFDQLRQSDPMRYEKLLHCKNLITPLTHMLQFSSYACGVTVEGEPIREAGIVEHARNLRAEQLAEFSRVLGDENAAYEGKLRTYLDRRVEALAPEYDRRRRDFQESYIEDNPQSAWIDVPAFNYPPQYESLEKIRSLMEQNGERYLANKALCDAMFTDLTHSLEAYAELKARCSIYGELQDGFLAGEKQKQDSMALSKLATRKMDALMADSYDVIQQFENVNDALKVFLRGAAPNALNVAVLAQFGYDAEPQFRESIMRAAGATAVRTRWQQETLTRLLSDPRVQVGSHESPFVQRTAAMFRQGDDEHNIALLNHLEQVRALGSGVPDRDFYERTRELIRPYVQKVLDWDMNAALAMDDQALADAQEQLDALFCDNMFVADIMKMKHWTDLAYGMKQELLGDRIYDFSQRASVLRGLYEKSRGLALKRAAKLGPLQPDMFTRVEWTNKIGTQDNTGAFYEDRISVGNRLLESESARAEQYRDINSEAFKERAYEHILYTAKIGNIYQQGKFHAVEQQFWNAREKLKEGKEELSEEERVIGETMIRLHDQGYRLAAFDEAEAKRLGVPENIGEMLFRSFTRYTESEGGRTMTQGQFRRMLLDLGAGYGMKRGETPETEIAQARERNMRGCREYKETMRLQYGFLAKKYGYAVEDLSMKYIAEHYMEITKDFANLQTDTNMMSKIPGFLDMDNPEDVMLKHQVDYYNMMGFAVLNALNPFIGSGMSEAEIIAETRRQARLGDVGAGRAYLIAHQNEHPFAGTLNPGAVMDERRQID